MNILRKRFTFLTVAFLSLLLSFSLTACDSSDSGTAGSEQTSNSQAASNSGVQNKVQFPLTLRVGYSTNADDPRGIALDEFKKVVEEKTGGDILIEAYPGGKLGSDSELIAGVMDGSVDMTVSSAGNYAIYATRMGVSALPFLFESFEDAWRFIDSDEIQAINADLEQFNMHVLAYFDNGFRCVTTSENIGSIENIDDMVGLNIRTPESQIIMETMSTLGARPKSYPFANLKAALADGTFDAQENPIPVIYNNALYDVQKYLSVTNHSYDAMPLTIRNDIWNELPDEYKDILSEAADSAEAQNRQLVKKQTEDYVLLLQENGMEVNYPDLAPFKEKTASVINAFSDLYGEDLVNYVKNFE